MTEGEKMVWAATYAASWVNSLKDPHRRGEVYVPGCIEEAWAAVLEMGQAEQRMIDGWGRDHEVTKMLQEMMK